MAAEKLAKLRTSCVELATAQIYMMISFLLNTIVMVLFARTDKASDKEWSRIRVFNYICIAFQVVSGFLNIMRMVSQLSLDEDTKCEGAWIGVSLTLQSLFMIALVFNVVSVSIMRIELVSRIHKYFYFKPEPSIAIKY